MSRYAVRCARTPSDVRSGFGRPCGAPLVRMRALRGMPRAPERNPNRALETRRAVPPAVSERGARGIPRIVAAGDAGAIRLRFVRAPWPESSRRKSTLRKRSKCRSGRRAHGVGHLRFAPCVHGVGHLLLAPCARSGLLASEAFRRTCNEYGVIYGALKRNNYGVERSAR